MKYFHCCKASFYADCLIHIVFEILVQSVDAESHSCIGKCFYQLYITQYQIRFCLDTDFRPASLKLFQKGSLYSASCGLYGSVTEPMKNSLPQYLFGFLIGSQCFTLLCMPGETLHKRRIAVFTGMGAADIWVDGVITDRQVGLGYYVFYKRFFYHRWHLISICQNGSACRGLQHSVPAPFHSDRHSLRR